MLDLGVDLQEFLDRIDAAVAIFDAEGGIQILNRSGARLLAVDSEEARGQSTYDGWVVLDEQGSIIPTHLRPIPRVLATGQPVLKQVFGIVLKESGQRVWGEFSAQPIFGTEGKVRYVIATFIDLNERMRAEQALRESEERFRVAISGSSSGLYDADLNTGYVHYSPRFLDLMGFAEHPDELPPEMDEFERRLHPDDRGAALRVLEASLQEGAPFRTEFRMRKRDGSYAWYATNGSVDHDVSGQPVRLAGFITDITARKEAEKALRDSEARLRAINEASPMGIFVTDESGNCIYRNRVYQELTGLSTQESHGTGWIQAVHPDDRQRISTEWYEAVRANRPYEATFRYKRRDATTVWAYVKAARLVDHTAALGYVGVVEDITARKSAEEALRDERDLNAAILETTGALIMVLDRKGHIVRFNAQCEKVSGYPFVEVASKPFWERLVSPEDISSAKRFFRQIVTGRFPATEENHWTSRTGVQRLIAWSYTAILDAEDRVRYVVATGLDVTDQRATEREVRESNERFKGFSEASFEGIAVLRDDLIADVNPRLCEMLGYTRRELTGMKLSAFTADPKEAEVLRSRETAGQSPRQMHQVRLVRRDGGEFPAEIRSRTMQNDTGSAKVIAVRDITLRVTAENQLKESLDQLRILSGHLQAVREEERTRVAREVHDELGQLLTGIKLELFGLRDDIAKEVAGESVTTLQKDLDSIRGLVDQTIASVKRIATDLRPAILDTLGLVPALEWQTRDFEKRTGIMASFRSDVHNLPLDSDRTSAVFRIAQESLTNVARHSEATQVKVRLQTTGHMLVLRVEDNGIGLPTTDKVETTAFGIIGMRERATLLGGSITLTGRQQKGTKVVLKLPLPDRPIVETRK